MAETREFASRILNLCLVTTVWLIPVAGGSGIMFTIYNFEQCRIVQYECDITRVFYQKVSQLAHVKT